MAGYFGYSKSNNAIYAEDYGVFPASILAKKLNVKTEAVKSLMEPSEWHHTSCWYNATDYYNGSLLIPLSRNLMPDDYCDEDELYEAADMLITLRNFKPAQTIGWIDEDCIVEWIDWTGTRRRQKPVERREEHCRVEFNGKSTYKITTPNGDTFSKREGTNGFYIYRSNKDADCQAVA